MSRLEIIHLRSSGESPESLSRQIRESIGAEDASTEVIRLYHRDGLDTDVAVHIHRLKAPARPGPSDLGLQLAAALRAFGLVEHTLWEQME